MNTAALRRCSAQLTIAAAAVLAWSPLASLAGTASASLTNISLSVVDLDLNDGITAGFSFLDGAVITLAGVETRSLSRSDSARQEPPGFFVPLSLSSSVPGAQASSAVTPNGLAASGSTSAAGTFSGAGSSVRAAGPTFNSGLVLTPHTRMIIGGDYSASAVATDRAVCVGTEFGLLCEQAIATVSIAAVPALPELPGGELFFVGILSEFVPGGGVKGSDSRSGSFQVQLDNAGDLAADYFFSIFVNAGAISPIPEPETYALLLLGLGAVGIASRRRNRR